MVVDARSRFCRHCSNHVYNFAAFSAPEAAELIRAREGQVCARLFQRADGTVLTANCPVGAEKPVHWFRQLISAAAACLCLSGISAFSGEKSRATGSSPRALLGEICVSVPRTNSNTNIPPLLGKISVAPPPLNSPTPPTTPNTDPTSPNH